MVPVGVPLQITFDETGAFQSKVGGLEIVKVVLKLHPMASLAVTV